MIIALFENNSSKLEQLKDWLIDYATVHKIGFDILSFTDQNSVTACQKYSKVISIAFLSLENENSLKIGLKLAVLNPFCVICFYSLHQTDLYPLLNSRPFEFFIWNWDSKTFTGAMDKMIEFVIQSKGVFCHKSKNGTLYFPVRNITYFESDLKYVNIEFSQNSFEGQIFIQKINTKLFSKLSEIENELIQQNLRCFFVRIHKSYMVNMIHIISVSKAQHTVLLSSSVELPISEAYYKDALNRIDQFHSIWKDELILPN